LAKRFDRSLERLNIYQSSGKSISVSGSEGMPEFARRKNPGPWEFSDWERKRAYSLQVCIGATLFTPHNPLLAQLVNNCLFRKIFLKVFHNSRTAWHLRSLSRGGPST
jgi:hypothetical protein